MGTPRVKAVPTQHIRAIMANWRMVSRKMSLPSENLVTAMMWQARKKPAARVSTSPRARASPPPSQETRPIPVTDSRAASTFQRVGRFRSTAQ